MNIEEPVTHEENVAEVEPVQITFKSLLTSGAQFGHKTSEWNPEMAHYIYGSRNGVHIIDINETLALWDKVRAVIVEAASKGKEILMVGTKKQAQKSIREQAERCGCHYVDYRWSPGLLTNFDTSRKSVAKMKRLKALLEAHKSGEASTRNKKELLLIEKEVTQLEKELGGVANLKRPPDLLFVTDLTKDKIAVMEAQTLDIPIVALCDTNVSIRGIDHLLPSNDDAVAALTLFTSAVADAILEGSNLKREIVVIQNTASETKEEKGLLEKQKVIRRTPTRHKKA